MTVRTVFALVLMLVGISAAAPIEPLLLEQMAQAKDGERFGVMIALERQLDGENIIRTIKNKEQRWEVTVSTLKEMARVEQAGLLAELRRFEAEARVRDITPLWIVNAVYCQATPDVILKVAERPEVWFVQWDLIPTENALGLSPATASRDATDGSFTVEWNVRKVKADSVWYVYGYTGDGVVIGNIDTGCDYNHTDLRNHMWTDPNYPYHGWNFEQGNNNPMDAHGHGTHTCGTNAGDGSGGDTTGMAPKARIMVCRTKTSLSSPLPDTIAENTVMNSMQFCVAPPLSPENHAHVLSMSLGWYHSWNPRRALWRQSVTNVATAGLSYFIAAGNEGSSNPPDNVRTPGDCPSPWHHPAAESGGRSGSTTIGATDNNDNIASFSSWGPVSWSAIAPYNDYPYPPGLLKPDFSAPGVNVTSCRLGGGYTQMSGTSMATPCAAGIAALMLEKNPNLLPEQVDSIMQMAVLPLGTPPKNNTYGTGRIDAMRAVELTPLPYPWHDIAVTAVLSPLDSCYPEYPVVPRVVVANLGHFPEPNVVVWCRVDSAGQQVYRDTGVVALIDSAGVDTLELPAWRTGPGGNVYDLTFWCSRPDDTLNANDTIRSRTLTRNHDLALSDMNIGDRIRANRPLNPTAYVTNVGGYVERGFSVYCRIDSAGNQIYSESLAVDSIGLGATRNLTFPSWAVGPESATYRVTMFHTCATDLNRGNDTLRRTTMAGMNLLRIAIEMAQRSQGRNPPNACYALDSLCRRQGWYSYIVTGTEIDEWPELMNFDVVVTGDAGYADHDFGVYDDVLLRWVRAGGGFVGVGWLVFATYLNPGPGSPMDSVCAVMARDNYGFQSSGAIRILDTLHPITRGVSNFPVYEYSEYSQAGLWPGMAMLADYSGLAGKASVACGNVGTGRTVYLGPIYLGDFAANANEPYYSDSASVKLLRQAIMWAASGPGAGLQTPDIARPGAARLDGVYPNPVLFGTTVIRYSLPVPGRVRLVVYDLAGKLVRTLATGQAPAGTGRIVWNRTDDAGRAVAAGVYFCRLETDDASDTRKVVLR